MMQITQAVVRAPGSASFTNKVEFPGDKRLHHVSGYLMEIQIMLSDVLEATIFWRIHQFLTGVTALLFVKCGTFSSPE